MSIKVYRSLEELESLRWFWSSCPGRRDSDLDWFITLHRSAEGEMRPHVLGLYRGEELQTILIGQAVRRRLPFLVGYYRLFNPLVRVLEFPYGALRGNDAAENCSALIRSIVESLRKGEADLALLGHVDLDSRLIAAAKREVGFLFADRIASVRSHWIRRLPTTVDELQGSFSWSQGKQFRRIAKKLACHFPGQVKIVRLGGASELERIMEDVEKVVAKSWQRKMGFTGFTPSANQRALLRTAAEKGWLRAYIVYISEKPCAFWLGTVYQGTFSSDFLGYDPDYAKYALGTHLLAYILQDLCSEGVRAVDFGFSEEEYKRRFGNLTWKETNLHLFPATLRGLKLSLLMTLTTLLSNTCRVVVQRMGLMLWARKVWRKTGIGVKREMAAADRAPLVNEQ